LRILTLSSRDEGGGAANVARALAGAYARRGHRSMTMVGTKRGTDADVVELPDHADGFGWPRLALGARDVVRPLLGRVRGAGKLHELMHVLGRPRRLVDRLRGIEDWTLPASWRLLELAPERPDLVHAHNLHSFRGSQGHFDLRALAPLSRAVPVVLTLHDAWLTTGHCAHSLGCCRWETGCGACPDLTLYPAVRRDATAENWRRKRAAFAGCRLYVATPCRWLMERVERSMLAPAVAQSRVIANGVDRGTFRPGDKGAARSALGLAGDAHVLLFAAPGVGGSFKDFQTVRRALPRIAERAGGRAVIVVALGEDATPDRAGRAEVRYVPFVSAPEAVARYFRAADVYLHAAKAETFPSAVLEAMASATPVVATAVGGVPEQVSADAGRLVPPGDADALADAAASLLGDPELRARMGEAGLRRVAERFDLDGQARAYLDWFSEILERRVVPAGGAEN
jgi:glycosyltransferase involved in cell wall biosynthesis